MASAQAQATPAPIRVLIVDDHPIVRDGLKNMLLAFDDLELVGEAGDGSEALVKCQQLHPDVILMDMAMP
ncbi:MAG: response regulator, partial [Caldilinea sp.]